MQFSQVFRLCLALQVNMRGIPTAFPLCQKPPLLMCFNHLNVLNYIIFFFLRGYNMRWECCIILVVFFLLTLNPFWRQRGEVIKLEQGDSVGPVVLNCGILNSYSGKLHEIESCLLLMFLYRSSHFTTNSAFVMFDTNSTASERCLPVVVCVVAC
jgi:hypothetical protein